MSTIVKLSEKSIQDACHFLQAGAIIAFPTETVFGLAVDATNPLAVERLFELKGRDIQKPFSIMLGDLTLIQTYALVSDQEQRIINHFFPGPLTLLLRKTSLISDLVTAGSPLVGIRIPDHSILDLLKTYPFPLAVSSANISGFQDARCAADVYNIFGDKVSCILDQGCYCTGLPSTVARVDDTGVHVLRQGALTQLDLESVLV